MTIPFRSNDDNRIRQDNLTWREGDMPYSEEFGDFYYSQADGRAESRHVFLAGNGLPERFAAVSSFTIAELGFGTGLNFLETWDTWDAAAPEDAELVFHSFELNLLEPEVMARALSAWPDLARRTKELVGAWPGRPQGDIELAFCEGARTVRLHVHQGLAHEVMPDVRFQADAWFLDGFSPSRNPQMWSAELLGMVAAKTAPGGTFATYSAAGWVRRNLQAAGFDVEKRPGHAGKRDMSIGKLKS
jgi:tRNA U34 5-methylaminomethyl-2-thiouridine-forming methyltransferase MnmC